MSTPYIPPPGLYFRLVGYISQSAIFSRDTVEPEVWQLNASHGEHPDQWFRLATAKNKNEYMIEGRSSGRYLFSQKSEPRVGHKQTPDRLDETVLFTVEPGTHQYKYFFRLITHSQGLALYSRLSPDPTFGNSPAKNFDPDQLFEFVWEEMNVDDITFNLKAGKVLSSKPIIIAEKVVTNETSSKKNMTFSADKAIVGTSSFNYLSGFPVSFAMEFSGFGIPALKGAEFATDEKVKDTWSWGKTISYTTQQGTTFQQQVEANTSVRAVFVVNQGTLEVPFTMTLSSKNNVTVETKGVWQGLSCWDARANTVVLSEHDES